MKLSPERSLPDESSHRSPDENDRMGNGGDLTTPSAQETQTAESEKKDGSEKAVSFSYGIVMLRTRKLLNILDNLARYKIFARLGWLMIVITIAAAAFMIWLMVDSTYIVLTSDLKFRCAIGAATAAECNAIGVTVGSQLPLQSYLLLPGINPFIPVIYGLVGIIIAVVIHEGTHGVIARSVRLPVKSTGILFLLFVPIGAFVEIDEKLIQKARFRDSGRIMAGGPGSNIIVAVVALVLLLLLVGGLVPHQFDGVYVGSIVQSTPHFPSPADTLAKAGNLQAGDLVVAANGSHVHSDQDLRNILLTTRPNQTLSITIDHLGQDHTYNILLGTNPNLVNNHTIGFIGIGQAASQSDLVNVRSSYSAGFITHPSVSSFTLYLVVPGIYPSAEGRLPFSSTLAPLYYSPTLGDYWYPVALTLFWIWFINANLALFNAIPLYPLDGGQAMLNFFSHFGRKSVENRAKLITTVSSVLMLGLILTFLFLPRLLSLINF